MITKECTLVKYTVDSWKVITAECQLVFKENDVEISRSYHKSEICPGDGTTGQLQEIIDLASSLHTQAVIDAWNARP